ncbi:hypothetical protein NL676_004305 [Syzygium grande]|nr:hypothetical protein NL676_004305 [Syzygium grande]
MNSSHSLGAGEDAAGYRGLRLRDLVRPHARVTQPQQGPFEAARPRGGVTDGQVWCRQRSGEGEGGGAGGRRAQADGEGERWTRRSFARSCRGWQRRRWTWSRRSCPRRREGDKGSKSPASSDNNDNKAKDKEAEYQKPKEPPVTTVALKLKLHCTACIRKIERRIISKIKGL